MLTVTLTVPDEIKSEIMQFPWVNWSEVARENLLSKDNLEHIREMLNTKEEQDFIKWSVELGMKAKKGSFKRLLAALPRQRREALLGRLPPEKRRELEL